MKQMLTALIAGLLFGAGLTISTMVDPLRVLAFLDVFGDWDPTLAFVMGGALTVYLPVYQFFIKPSKRTLFNEPCHLPDKTRLDAPLLVGAILFGIGWGLSGICPGPGIANLTQGSVEIFVFIAALLIGMIGVKRAKRSH
ncbi:YeeE/YedE family protein [Salinimonas sp. HHU 13199]|uniref:YeeE/YedE family protein n=1 Tax=Salinimonas profundi TaxID=2729140 RepID=A0ABR8LLE0_9ALTE|nr:YeeE/YedE family protein [Salinimonas profundi]MBD3584869.1 YeeE/YedE family protein [Salinimonas profundi]